jgi:hypothetical protein
MLSTYVEEAFIRRQVSVRCRTNTYFYRSQATTKRRQQEINRYILAECQYMGIIANQIANQAEYTRQLLILRVCPGQQSVSYTVSR